MGSTDRSLEAARPTREPIFAHSQLCQLAAQRQCQSRQQQQQKQQQYYPVAAPRPANATATATATASASVSVVRSGGWHRLMDKHMADTCAPAQLCGGQQSPDNSSSNSSGQRGRLVIFKHRLDGDGAQRVGHCQYPRSQIA